MSLSVQLLYRALLTVRCCAANRRAQGTESGTVLARATFSQQYAFSGTVDNTIQSQQLPYNFNNGAQLGCATITSSFSGQFQPQLQGNVPTGQICDSQQFSWSALYGPFSDTQCGNYQVRRGSAGRLRLLLRRMRVH